MATVYRSEVTWGAVTLTEPNPDDTTATIWFSAGDDNDRFAIRAYVQYEEVGIGSGIFEKRAKFEFTNLVPDDPSQGTFVSGTFFLYAGVGDNGAAFLSGGTMAIEKDEAADELRFITPLGTVTKVLSGFGAQDNTKLRVHAMAHQLVRLDAAVTLEFSTDWTNFYSKDGGTNFRGAALTSTAPGIWADWVTVVNAGTAVNNADAQGASSYHTELAYTHPADSPRATVTRRYRLWNGGDTVDAGPGTGALLDMTRAPEHGTLWAAVTYQADLGLVQVRRSFDSAETWTDTNAYSAGGTSNNSLSLNWHAGRVWLTWYNGTEILQSNSFDWGVTWSSPVTLAISGTNPRHLVSPHGLSFYFVISGGNLVVYRSGDFGSSFIDGSPITVVAGIDTQTVAAEIMPNGALVVGYIAASAWTQLASLDWGKSWA